MARAQATEPASGLAGLVAPALRSRWLAHAERYERLGSLVSNLQERLAGLADPARMPRRLLSGASMPSSGAMASGWSAAQRASWDGTYAIALAPGAPATAASLTTGAVALNLSQATPATAATLTAGTVALNLSGQTTAAMTGSSIRLPGKKVVDADFGALTINGVKTTLGVFRGSDEQQAAQFVADRLNANASNTFVASVKAGTSQVILTSKAPGTGGNLRIDQVQADSDGVTSNDQSTGFAAGTTATAVDGTTDYGAVTINGVTTTFGTLSNTGQTAQSVTQWLVDKLNANGANDFTATVGGTNRDQVVLASKQTGSASRIDVQAVSADSDGLAGNDGQSGFVAGTSAQGLAASLGETDFGAVTINGVTTQFGTLSNAGLTTQAAAQYLVDRLNANPSNSVVAALGGTNGDQIILTSKATGSEARIEVQGVHADSDGSAANDGDNGLVAGAIAWGSPAVAGPTDFGSITVNGVTTTFGVLDGSRFTPQSAAEYLAERLNQTNSTVSASVRNGYLHLESLDGGSLARLSIDAIAADTDGDASNDRALGFGLGVARGEDPMELATDAIGARVSSSPVASETGALLDPVQVRELLERAEAFAAAHNDYVRAIRDEAGALPRSVSFFGDRVRDPMRREQETLEGLGFRFEGDRLTLDQARLQAAVEHDAAGVGTAFQRLEGRLGETLGAQRTAFEEMRAATSGASRDAATASQVAASLYRIQYRADGLSSLLESLRSSQEQLAKQQERLKEQAETLEADPAEAKNTPEEPGRPPAPSADRFPWLRSQPSDPERTGLAAALRGE